MKTTLRALVGIATLLPLAGCLGSSSSNNPYMDTATSVVALQLTTSGHMDVVTSFNRAYADGTNNGFVSTRLGQGGTGVVNFGTPIRSGGGNNPGPIVATDLDGDGHPDLVMCDAASPSLTLLYGSATSAGSFGSAVTLPLGSNRFAYAVAVADFNGDGKPDIAVAASGGSSVLIFLQNTGGFTGVTPIAITVAGTPYSIATAKLSGVNYDLAVGLSTGKLAVLKGNGNGTFQPEVDYACGTTPSAIKIADLDGVNGPDIAVADYGASSSVIIFLNNGTGAFATGVAYPTGDAYASDLAIGDLGNGKLDIAVANAGVPGDPGSISVLFNNGSGVLGAATLYPGLYGPLSVAIADIDGDGRNDIVSADGTGVVRLQSATTPGTFVAPVQLKY